MPKKKYTYVLLDPHPDEVLADFTGCCVENFDSDEEAFLHYSNGVALTDKTLIAKIIFKTDVKLILNN